MKSWRRLLFFSFIGASILLGCQPKEEAKTQVSTDPPKEFIMAGSGSNLPITGKLIEKYTQVTGIKIEMPQSIGSSGGIKAVQDSSIDIGLTSRLLNKEEKEMGLEQLSYARIGVVLGVNQDVPDDNLTNQELVDIYLGKKSSWQDGKMIVVLSREDGDSSNKVLEQKVPGFSQALQDSFTKRRWQEIYTDAEAAKAIITTSASIGLTDTSALKALNLKIKPLRINGIPASSEHIQNGSYKLYKDLYLVYKRPQSERIKKFLEFVYSDEGARVISANGGIPLKGK